MDIRLHCTVLCCLLLTACTPSQTDDDLHAYIEGLKQHRSAAVHLLDRFQLRKTYYLNDESLSSPFPKSVIQDSGGSLTQAPLQRYSLDALHLLGIIVENGQASAVIITPAPDSMTYSIQVGDVIGNQGGTVTAISAYSVTISEPGENNSSHRIVLHLQN